LSNEAPRIRAVIVDDEPLARDAVRTLVSADPDIIVVGEASNGVDAVSLIRAETPDLLFLDVQMPDLGGFGVLAELGADVPAAVLFVTAHDEHALRAFEVHALDYILKPFGRDRMGKALARVKRQLAGGTALEGGSLKHLRTPRDTNEANAAALESVPEADPAGRTEPAKRLGIRRGGRVVLVSVEDVDWIEADGDYVRLHVGEKDHLLTARMSELESRLGTAGFQRIHRSTIVNIARVRELDRDPDGGGATILENGVRLRVAESRWADFTRALGLDL
jgi:two-component system LytT family response regulator